MAVILDHFAWATPDLDAAMDMFERLSGVRPAHGGSHPGMGTRNALASLGPGLYLALDGPDPAQPLIDNNGARMKALARPDLFLFAVATDDLDAAERALNGHGIETRRTPGARMTRAGTRLEWDFLDTPGHDLGPAMPHVTRWRTPHHPSAEAPGGCRMLRFEVGFPEPERLRPLYEALGLTVDIVPSARAGLRLALQGQGNPFELTSAP